MGKIKNNVVTRGFSGKFGDDLVFRQLDNQTVFSRHTPITKGPSQQQSAVRSKFTQASMFASAAIDNPQASQEYKLMAELQGLKSAYLAALTDYLTLPEIGGIFTEAYTGQVGDLFSITDKVPYKIKEIDVTIVGANGSVVESGKATPNQLKWRYAATVANPQVKGSKIVLVTRDRRGKESTLEQLL